MDNVAISVIMPCHNYGRYLSDAIHSLIGGSTSLGNFEPQTFQHFEIIIVDDASEDDTRELAAPFLNEHITYIRNENNIGTAATLNVGIKEAQGRYITFLSADDMMETTRLAKLYQAMLDYPHKLAYDNLMTFANGKRKDIMPLMDYDFEKLLYKNVMHAGIMYPRQAWVDCGGYPEQFRDGREDWAFNVALGKFGYCGVHVKEPLYLYRWEGQNRSLRNAGSQMRMQFLGMMQAQFPDLYRGERPIMCCGNKAKQKVLTQPVSKSRRGIQSTPHPPPLSIGSEGMVLIEYLLPKAGTVVYRGAETQQEYAFGGKRKTGYVDARDVPALLARIEDRRHAFALAQTEQPTVGPENPVPTKEIITEPIKDAVILPEQPAPAKKRGRPKSA